MSIFYNNVATRIARAVELADTTKEVIIAPKAVSFTAKSFKKCFGNKRAVIIADGNTLSTAGNSVMESMRQENIELENPFIISDPDLHAEYKYVEQAMRFLGQTSAIPIAVGSGTINDITKLAAYKSGRPYMVVATAASMDGYTSFGASITKDDFKQTMFCPAPTAVIADIDIIRNAPDEMNASGYADLAAKVPAGADWILADQLNIELIDHKAWSLVQDMLHKWISDPKGIKEKNEEAIVNLMEGLIMSGLAMQASQSSRPASGADHQFSHLWDDENHTFEGSAPAHGFKVGIGTICSEALYQNMLNLKTSDLEASMKSVKQYWPSWNQIENTIKQNFTSKHLADSVIEQSKAKYVAEETLIERLALLCSKWETLKERLNVQLLGPAKMQGMIRTAGAPYLPEQIGITYERLKDSYRKAQLIRKRYTVLDLAFETGMWTRCTDAIFSGNGFWAHNMNEDSK